MTKKVLSFIFAVSVLSSAMGDISAFALDNSENTAVMTASEEADDIFPKTEDEYEEFVKNYGEVSVHGKYIVCCASVSYSTGAEFKAEQSGTAELKEVKNYSVTKIMEGVGGGTSKVVYIYEAVVPGTVRLDITKGRPWDKEGSDHQENTLYYSISEDLVITEISESEFTDGDSKLTDSEEDTLPEWIPTDFSDAMGFDNHHGISYAKDGYICLLSMCWSNSSFEMTDTGSTAEYEVISRTYNYEIPEKPDIDDAEAYNKYLEKLSNMGVSAYEIDHSMILKNQDIWYEARILKVKTAGTVKVDLKYSYEEEHEFTFEADENGKITETDMYGFVPDCYHGEALEFTKNNEAVSVHNGYIVYCDDVAYDGGYTLGVDIEGEDNIENVLDSVIRPESIMPPPPGSSGITILVYKPVRKGKVKFEFKQYRQWNDEVLSDIVKYYSIDEDMSVTEITESDYNGQPAAEVVLGDANGDGAVTVSDISVLNKWLLNIGEISDEKAADMNEDGKVNIVDLILMKSMMLGN